MAISYAKLVPVTDTGTRANQTTYKYSDGADLKLVTSGGGGRLGGGAGRRGDEPTVQTVLPTAEVSAAMNSIHADNGLGGQAKAMEWDIAPSALPQTAPVQETKTDDKRDKPTYEPKPTGKTPKPTATYIDNGVKKTGTVVATPTEETAQQISYLDTLRGEYQKMYDEQVAANNAAAAANVERVLEQIDASRAALNDSYRQTNKQLYRDYMDVLRTTPQALATMGYSGGMSESARLGVDTNYQEALAENERARIAALNDLNTQGAQAEYEANAAATDANTAARQQLYANLVNVLAQEQAERQAQAQTMAAAGDFTGYRDLGYSQAQVDALTRMWLAENPSYLSAWISAHPSDAKRLGVKVATKKKATGGARYSDFEREALDMLKNGGDLREIVGAVNAAAADGAITSAKAADIKSKLGLQDAATAAKREAARISYAKRTG